MLNEEEQKKLGLFDGWMDDAWRRRSRRLGRLQSVAQLMVLNEKHRRVQGHGEGAQRRSMT